MEHCSQCSLELFGEDFHDFSGLITEEQEAEGYGAIVTCASCGNIYVDRLGARIRFVEPGDEFLDKIDLPNNEDLRVKK